MTTKRDLLWISCLNTDGVAVCNLCGLPVRAGDAWDESHVGAPKALGGKDTGIAHLRCNREHGAKIVTPFVAKAKRMHRKHAGIAGPGLGPHAMAGGKRDKITKKLDGSVVPRRSQAERHRDAMAGRRIGVVGFSEKC